MENTKFLIILAYYKRPKMVINALNSIKNLKYSNWQLDFIDDSGDDVFRDTLLNFGLDNSKVNYIPTYDTDEYKKTLGGSRHGHFMNESIKKSDAEVVVILCDDDALIDDGLNKLDKFYTENPTSEFDKIEKAKYTINLNNNYGPTSPSCRCDSSQVTFRRKNFTENNIWYPSPQTRNLDANIYQNMYNAIGWCYPTCEYVQYKGVFAGQLGSRDLDQIVAIC